MAQTVQDTDFTATCAVDAAPDAVLDAAATAPGVSGWWFPTDDTEAGLRVRMGEAVDLEVRREPGLVRWQVVDCRVEPEWNGTEITFAVEPTSDGSSLTFTHHGLAALSCADVCFAGWSYYLPSLVSYAETGTGRPGPRPR